jgi:acetyl-CoA acetyltransferase
MLNLVNPAGAVRRPFGRRWQARFNEIRRLAGTHTQQHAGLIETRAQRVESVFQGFRHASATHAMSSSTAARRPSIA